MAEKTSTIELKVNLDCPKCYKKVRKTLCKFKEIQSWNFEENQKKVIISGPFNPECLIKKLYCKVGCNIITGHEIKKPKEPDSSKKNNSKEEPSKESKQPKQEPSKESKQTKQEPSKESKQPKQEPPPPPPVVAGPIYVGPICCCRLCYEGRPWDGYCRRGKGGCYYDTCCRDCCERRPWDGPCTRSGYDSGYRFFSEEDSSCRTM